MLSSVGCTAAYTDHAYIKRDTGFRQLELNKVAWRIGMKVRIQQHVVDGHIGFTEGVGISDPWLGNAQSKDNGRDSHYRTECLAVAQMQAAYFVPDELGIETFVSARKRGVKIEIIVPGFGMDVRVMQHASRSLWGALLDADVEMYEYQPTMYHYKVLIVDDLWVSVGSTNFDNRSFRLNDEANSNICDPNFAGEQVKVFMQDKDKFRLITRTEFKNRSAIGKLFESLANFSRSPL